MEMLFDDPGEIVKTNPLMRFNMISEAGFVTYRTDKADTLDVYTDSKIEFDIIVDVNVKEISNSFLILSVYDVDSGAEVPEVDKVFLNNRYIGNLIGDNNAWSFTTFPLKPKWIKGKKNSKPGINTLRIEVDSLKTDNFWVYCDWGALKANIGFQVVSITPYSLGVGSNLHEIKIKFNERVDEDSLFDNIKLTYIDFNEIKSINCGLKYNKENNVVIFSPLTSLDYGIEYTVKVGKNVRSERGNYLKNEKSSSFVPMPTLKFK
jgi:hypothetical protein